jgi:hypothetical protein
MAAGGRRPVPGPGAAKTEPSPTKKPRKPKRPIKAAANDHVIPSAILVDARSSVIFERDEMSAKVITASRIIAVVS